MTNARDLLPEGDHPVEDTPTTVRWMVITLLVLVSMAYLTMFVSAYQGSRQNNFSPADIVLLISLGVVYTFLVMYPEWITSYLPAAFGPWVYFAVIYGLVLWITWLGQMEGQIWLLILPPIGTAAEFNWIWIVVVSAISLFVSVYGFALVSGVWDWSLLLFLSPAVFFVAAFTYISVRERESRREIEALAVELRDANLKLSEYAAKVEELTIVRERNRLAREIHDTLGHYLTVVHVQLGAAMAVMKTQPEKALEAIDRAQRLTQEGLVEVRQSVAILREGQETRPLAETIPELIQLTQAAGINTSYTLLGNLPTDLPRTTSQTIYRSIQEGLTNVRKHAKATSAEVILDFSRDERILLTIKDNGRGSETVEGGFGLIGMRERVHLSGGSLKIQSSPDQGMVLVIDLPRNGPGETPRSSHE